MAEITADCYKYSKNYTLALKDNLDMLEVVFGTDGDEKQAGFLDFLISLFTRPSAEDAIQQAAVNVYNLYSADDINEFYLNMSSKMLEDFLVDTVVWDQISDLVFEVLLGFDAWYSVAVAVEKWTFDAVWESTGITASDDMALLYYHLNVLSAAYEAFSLSLTSGGSGVAANCRQEDMENLRLSAIMTLLSSKKCFEIMRDNNLGYEEYVSYCNNRIDNITQQLALLYLAAERVMIDGIEYFNSAIQQLSTEQTHLQAVDEPMELSIWRTVYTTQYWPYLSQSVPNGQVNTWYDMSVSDIYLDFADLTGDGVLEMIVIAVGSGFEDEYPVTAGQVLMLEDNEYGYTELYYNRIDGYISLHNDIQIGLARDAEGQYGILEIWDSNWQGDESSYYQFYSYAADGTERETVYNNWQEAFGAEQREEISAQYGDMKALVYAQHETHENGGMDASYWFSYLDERSQWIFEEDTSDYVDDGGFAKSYVDNITDDWGYEEENDTWDDYVLQELTTNIWHGNVGEHSLMVFFTGDMIDLTMHIYVDADATDYSTEVMLAFGTGTDVQIVDDRAYVNYLPSIISVSVYYIYFEPELNEIYLFFDNGDTYIFSTSTGVVLE